mmetsp:Transcript_11346/g.21510  ORF Transcript_11346/g.21510 Transcript_11346/m.21510 type:complete len:497 (+) Transcript_11346:73-1563(+)
MDDSSINEQQNNLDPQFGGGVYGATGDESSPVLLSEVIEDFGFRQIHVKLLLVQWLIASCASAVVSGPPYILPYIRQEYGVRSWESAMIHSGVLFGAIFGVVIFGPLNDMLGRRICIMVELVGLSVCALAHLLLPTGPAFPNFFVLIAIRVAIGCFFGPLAVFAPLHFAEFLPIANRGLLISLVGLGWNFGALYAIMMGKILEANWRMLLASPVLLCLVACPILYFVPESPRFLYVSKMVHKGRQVVTQVLDSPVLLGRSATDFRFSEAPQNVVVSQAHGTGKIDEPETGNVDRLYKLFSKEHRQSTTVCVLLFACIAGASYSTLVWTPSILKDLLSLGKVPYEIFFWGEVSSAFGTALCAFTVDQFGRTSVAIGSFVAAAVSVDLLIYMPHYVLILILFNVNQVTYAVVWSVVCLWSTEAFPTDVRATANGLGSLSGRLTAMSLPVVLGMVMDKDFGVMSGMSATIHIIAFVLVLGAAVALSIPHDTAKAKMPDV